MRAACATTLFLDAVTALNQHARRTTLGHPRLSLFGDWAGNRSIWRVWDIPAMRRRDKCVAAYRPGRGQECQGEILRMEERPTPANRAIIIDHTTNDHG